MYIQINKLLWKNVKFLYNCSLCQSNKFILVTTIISNDRSFQRAVIFKDTYIISGKNYGPTDYLKDTQLIYY